MNLLFKTKPFDMQALYETKMAKCKLPVFVLEDANEPERRVTFTANEMTSLAKQWLAYVKKSKTPNVRVSESAGEKPKP